MERNDFCSDGISAVPSEGDMPEVPPDEALVGWRAVAAIFFVLDRRLALEKMALGIGFGMLHAMLCSALIATCFRFDARVTYDGSTAC